MCLAVPAKIVELSGEMALVEIQGVRREVSIVFVENPKVGDWVLVHAGFAIRKWSPEEIDEYWALVRHTTSVQPS